MYKRHATKNSPKASKKFYLEQLKKGAQPLMTLKQLAVSLVILHKYLAFTIAKICPAKDVMVQSKKSSKINVPAIIAQNVRDR